jgi:hypothetical protein
MARQRVHHPELGERQRHGLASPGDAEALQIERQVAALERFLLRPGLALQLGATKERGDARQQMRQADVLGQIVVGPEAQAYGARMAASASARAP